MMKKLDAREQLFVLCFFENGGNQTEALASAGWEAKNRNTLYRLANYHIHRKEVMDAIREESQRRTVMLSAKVQRAIENIVENPQHQDHFKALKLLRDDAGVSRAVERVLSVRVEVSDNEKIEAIKQFALAHGLSPTKFLGFDPDKAVEAEFSEVDTEAEEEERALGIRD
jgi:hypothetical protein